VALGNGNGMDFIFFISAGIPWSRWDTTVCLCFYLLKWLLAQCEILDHRKWVNLIYERNRVNISKVTHAGCEFSVKTAREYGASVDGAKVLGGWSDSSSFKPCYDHALPVDALLGAAMFDTMRPESHFLARKFLGKSFVLAGWTKLNCLFLCRVAPGAYHPDFPLGWGRACSVGRPQEGESFFSRHRLTPALQVCDLVSNGYTPRWCDPL
jgi:hypothetical protein